MLSFVAFPKATETTDFVLVRQLYKLKYSWQEFLSVQLTYSVFNVLFTASPRKQLTYNNTSFSLSQRFFWKKSTFSEKFSFFLPLFENFYDNCAPRVLFYAQKIFRYLPFLLIIPCKNGYFYFVGFLLLLLRRGIFSSVFMIFLSVLFQKNFNLDVFKL